MTRDTESSALEAPHEPWIEELALELEQANGESTVVLPKRPEVHAVAPVPERSLLTVESEGFTVVMPRAPRVEAPDPTAERGTVVIPRPVALAAVAPRAEPGEVTRIGNIEPWYEKPRPGSEPSTATRSRFAWLEWLRTSSPRHRIMLLLTPFALPAALVIVSPKKSPAPRRADVASSAVIARAPSKPPQMTPKAPEDAPNQGVGTRAGAGTGTLVRRAADAVAAGNESLALELYRELAAADPNVRAYAAASSILERRAAKGAR